MGGARRLAAASPRISRNGLAVNTSCGPVWLLYKSDKWGVSSEPADTSAARRPDRVFMRCDVRRLPGNTKWRLALREEPVLAVGVAETSEAPGCGEATEGSNDLPRECRLVRETREGAKGSGRVEPRVTEAAFLQGAALFAGSESRSSVLCAIPAPRRRSTAHGPQSFIGCD